MASLSSTLVPGRDDRAIIGGMVERPNKTRKLALSNVIAFVALLILLPGIYVGAYLYLHQRITISYVERAAGQQYIIVRPMHHYRVGDGYINRLFWPLEQIHQRLWPEVWNGTQEMVQ